ncbi:acyltransferase, partial [Escherichia coli]|nr:acyltransferase [Escherichia coli]
MYNFIRFASSPILVEFIIGMVLYEIFTAQNVVITKSIATIIFASCIGVFLTFYFSRSNYVFGMTGFGLWSVIVITGFLVYDSAGGVI